MSGNAQAWVPSAMSDTSRGDDLARLILDRARSRGEQPYVEDARGSRVLTYADLASVTTQWRHVLNGRALPPGGRVLVDVSDPLAFTAVHLGVIAAGGCSVPIDPDAPGGDVTRTVRATSPVLVVCDRDDRDAGLDLPTLGVDLATGGPLAGRLRTVGTAPGDQTPGSVALLTSGSTGEPKAVQLDERRLLHVAEAVAAHNELSEADRGYNPLPLFHVNAQVVGLFATLVAGATLVLDRRFHRRDFWELLAERSVTWVNAVPAILTILASQPVPTAPAGLRFVRSASAALPGSVRERIRATLGVPLVESYGMTEAASQITATALHESAPPGSVGRPVRVELQVRTPDLGSAPVGQIGRVWIRGAGVIRRYVGGRAADRFDAQGWLDTGDVGHLDGDGYLYLAGRADDVINRGGEMVYPREVEEVLQSDAGVHDAVVIGREDDVLGSVPVAYVMPAAPPRTIQAGERLVERLTARCAEQLSRFKRPVAIYLVEDFPRAATGKVRRALMRQQPPTPMSQVA